MKQVQLYIELHENGIFHYAVDMNRKRSLWRWLFKKKYFLTINDTTKKLMPKPPKKAKKKK